MDCSDKKCNKITVKPTHILMKYNVSENPPNHQIVTVVNISKSEVTFTLQYPITNYFYLESLPSKLLLAPAERFHINIYFKKVYERRLYHDCFTIVCENNCYNDIHLVAEPKHEFIQQIPKFVNFGHVPLGYLASKIITLPPVEEKIMFLFIALTNNPDFAITPTRGVVYNKPLEIKIFYKPTAYITFSARVQVHMPLIMSTPLTFTVSAYTSPGYIRDRINEISSKMENEPPPTSTSIPFTSLLEYKEIEKSEDEELFKVFSLKESYESFLQKQIKYAAEHADELLGPLGRYLHEEHTIKGLKENNFYSEVEEIRKEKIKINSHNSSKLTGPSLVDIHDVNKQIQWDGYMNMLKTSTVNWDPFRKPEYIKQRTIEYYSKREVLLFTDRLPNLWFIRYVNMIKFIDAARKIILKNRLLKALSILKSVTKEQIEMFELEFMEEVKRNKYGERWRDYEEEEEEEEEVGAEEFEEEQSPMGILNELKNEHGEEPQVNNQMRMSIQ